MKNRNARTLRNKNIMPRSLDSTEVAVGKPSESVKLHDYQSEDISIGLKKLQIYARIVRNRHLQDSIDWMEAICRPSTEPIISLLKRAQKELTDKKRLDPARLYVSYAVHERGHFQKKLFKTRDGGFTVRRSSRHRFVVKIREMPLPEYFHQVYILKRVPRAIVSDMMAALRDGRAPPHMQREFAPYVSSDSRRQHRKEMKWLDLNRKFDYFEERRKWILNYTRNLEAYKERMIEMRTATK